MDEVKARLSAYRKSREQDQRREQPAKDKNESDPDIKTESVGITPKTEQQSKDIPPSSNPRPWYITALYVILWLLLWGFFIEVEFGIVYLLFSAFAFIGLSLRGSRRRIGELSAYSVFNENCEAIEGTLTAAQFEREIRYGPTAVR